MRFDFATRHAGTRPNKSWAERRDLSFPDRVLFFLSAGFDLPGAPGFSVAISMRVHAGAFVTDTPQLSGPPPQSLVWIGVAALVVVLALAVWRGWS